MSMYTQQPSCAPDSPVRTSVTTLNNNSRAHTPAQQHSNMSYADVSIPYGGVIAPAVEVIRSMTRAAPPVKDDDTIIIE